MAVNEALSTLKQTLLLDAATLTNNPLGATTIGPLTPPLPILVPPVFPPPQHDQWLMGLQQVQPQVSYPVHLPNSTSYRTPRHHTRDKYSKPSYRRNPNSSRQAPYYYPQHFHHHFATSTSFEDDHTREFRDYYGEEPVPEEDYDSSRDPYSADSEQQPTTPCPSVRLISAQQPKPRSSWASPTLVELYVNPTQVKRICGFHVIPHLLDQSARKVFQDPDHLPPYLCRLDELGPWRPISKQAYRQSLVALDFVISRKQQHQQPRKILTTPVANHSHVPTSQTTPRDQSQQHLHPPRDFAETRRLKHNKPPRYSDTVHDYNTDPTLHAFHVHGVTPPHMTIPTLQQQQQQHPFPNSIAIPSLQWQPPTTPILTSMQQPFSVAPSAAAKDAMQSLPPPPHLARKEQHANNQLKAKKAPPAHGSTTRQNQQHWSRNGTASVKENDNGNNKSKTTSLEWRSLVGTSIMNPSPQQEQGDKSTAIQHAKMMSAENKMAPSKPAHADLLHGGKELDKLEERRMEDMEPTHLVISRDLRKPAIGEALATDHPAASAKQPMLHPKKSDNLFLEYRRLQEEQTMQRKSETSKPTKEHAPRQSKSTAAKIRADAIDSDEPSEKPSEGNMISQPQTSEPTKGRLKSSSSTVGKRRSKADQKPGERSTGQSYETVENNSSDVGSQPSSCVHDSKLDKGAKQISSTAKSESTVRERDEISQEPSEELTGSPRGGNHASSKEKHNKSKPPSTLVSPTSKTRNEKPRSSEPGTPERTKSPSSPPRNAWRHPEPLIPYPFPSKVVQQQQQYGPPLPDVIILRTPSSSRTGMDPPGLEGEELLQQHQERQHHQRKQQHEQQHQVDVHFGFQQRQQELLEKQQQWQLDMLERQQRQLLRIQQQQQAQQQHEQEQRRLQHQLLQRQLQIQDQQMRQQQYQRQQYDQQWLQQQQQVEEEKSKLQQWQQHQLLQRAAMVASSLPLSGTQTSRSFQPLKPLTTNPRPTRRWNVIQKPSDLSPPSKADAGEEQALARIKAVLPSNRSNNSAMHSDSGQHQRLLSMPLNFGEGEGDNRGDDCSGSTKNSKEQREAILLAMAAPLPKAKRKDPYNDDDIDVDESIGDKGRKGFTPFVNESHEGATGESVLHNKEHTQEAASAQERESFITKSSCFSNAQSSALSSTSWPDQQSAEGARDTKAREDLFLATMAAPVKARINSTYRDDVSISSGSYFSVESAIGSISENSEAVKSVEGGRRKADDDLFPISSLPRSNFGPIPPKTPQGDQTRSEKASTESPMHKRTPASTDGKNHADDALPEPIAAPPIIEESRHRVDLELDSGSDFDDVGSFDDSIEGKRNDLLPSGTEGSDVYDSSSTPFLTRTATTNAAKTHASSKESVASKQEALNSESTTRDEVSKGPPKKGKDAVGVEDSKNEMTEEEHMPSRKEMILRAIATPAQHKPTMAVDDFSIDTASDLDLDSSGTFSIQSEETSSKEESARRDDHSPKRKPYDPTQILFENDDERKKHSAKILEAMASAPGYQRPLRQVVLYNVDGDSDFDVDDDLVDGYSSDNGTVASNPTFHGATETDAKVRYAHSQSGADAKLGAPRASDTPNPPSPNMQDKNMSPGTERESHCGASRLLEALASPLVADRSSMYNDMFDSGKQSVTQRNQDRGGSLQNSTSADNEVSKEDAILSAIAAANISTDVAADDVSIDSASDLGSVPDSSDDDLSRANPPLEEAPICQLRSHKRKEYSKNQIQFSNKKEQREYNDNVLAAMATTTAIGGTAGRTRTTYDLNDDSDFDVDDDIESSSFNNSNYFDEADGSKELAIGTDAAPEQKNSRSDAADRDQGRSADGKIVVEDPDRKEKGCLPAQGVAWASFDIGLMVGGNADACMKDLQGSKQGANHPESFIKNESWDACPADPFSSVPSAHEGISANKTAKHMEGNVVVDIASNQSSNEDDDDDDWLSYPSGRKHKYADDAAGKDNDHIVASYEMPPPPPMPLSKASLDIATLGGPPLKTPAPVRIMGAPESLLSIDATKPRSVLVNRPACTSAFSAVLSSHSNAVENVYPVNGEAIDNGTEETWWEPNVIGGDGDWWDGQETHPSAAKALDDIVPEGSKKCETKGVTSLTRNELVKRNKLRPNEYTMKSYSCYDESRKDENSSSSRTRTISSSTTGKTLLVSTRLSLRNKSPLPLPESPSSRDQDDGLSASERNDSPAGDRSSTWSVSRGHNQGSQSSRHSSPADQEEEDGAQSTQPSKPRLVLKMTRIGGPTEVLTTKSSPAPEMQGSPPNSDLDGSESERASFDGSPDMQSSTSNGDHDGSESERASFDGSREMQHSPSNSDNDESESECTNIVSSPEVQCSPSQSCHDGSESQRASLADSENDHNYSPTRSPPTKPLRKFTMTRIGGPPTPVVVDRKHSPKAYSPAPSLDDKTSGSERDASVPGSDVDDGSQEASPAPSPVVQSKPRLNLKMTRIGAPASETVDISRQTPESPRSASPDEGSTSQDRSNLNEGSLDGSGSRESRDSSYVSGAASSASGGEEVSPPPSSLPSKKSRLNLKVARIVGPTVRTEKPVRAPSASPPKQLPLKLTMTNLASKSSVQREQDVASSSVGAGDNPKPRLQVQMHKLGGGVDVSKKVHAVSAATINTRTAIPKPLDDAPDMSPRRESDPLKIIGNSLRSKKSQLRRMISHDRSPIKDRSVMSDLSDGMSTGSRLSVAFAKGVVAEVGKSYLLPTGPMVSEGFDDYSAAKHAIGTIMLPAKENRKKSPLIFFVCTVIVKKISSVSKSKQV
jgi:hypothetical protein